MSIRSVDLDKLEGLCQSLHRTAVKNTNEAVIHMTSAERYEAFAVNAAAAHLRGASSALYKLEGVLRALSEIKDINAGQP